MLKHLVFNFAAIDPAVAGGVATFCQGLAVNVPPTLEGTHTSILVGNAQWTEHCPLPQGPQVLNLQGCSIRRMGHRLLRHLAPTADPLARFDRWRREVFRQPVRFPEGLAKGTLVHCPYQVVHPLVPKAWPLPYVINLHDIQHEHFPDFFSPGELAWRREHYLASAQHAMAVCVVDEWTRRDLLNHLPLDPDKVFVAPLGPTWRASTEAGDFTPIRTALGLPEAFLYYPAQTWPHKNHARLFEALRRLQEQGTRIPLVCSGHLTDRHACLVELAQQLGLEVHFLGLQPQATVLALYRQATAVVIPTLFEGGSGIPVLEAMALGKALAASTACGIPDAVGDAALCFDPLSPEEMAQTLGRLWTDPSLRAELSQKALARSSRWSWDRTAAAYRDIYREVLARWEKPTRKDLSR